MVKMCEQARKQEVIRLPHAKFDTIYRDLREKVEDGEYPFQSFLPSENTLTATYGCSRNTVRRAIAGLIERGYVQAIRGKGVRVLYRKGQQSSFSIGGIETFKESAARNHLHTETRVVRFEMIEADDALAARTGFRTGTPKLKTLKGFTWASALTLVKKFMPGYVRTSEEIAKDKLLADRELEAVEFIENDITKKQIPMGTAMAECGIMVAQDETFYVEPKKEETTV